jgi:hypothetical protein
VTPLLTTYAPQSLGLLAAWDKTSKDLRAAGFRGPEDEAIGARAVKLKELSKQLPLLKATAMVLGLCEKGTMSFGALQEPHKAQVSGV